MIPVRDYLYTIENPEGLFKTMVTITACRDNYKQVLLCSGGNACIFKVMYNGELVMVKCYITKLTFLREKYHFLSQINSHYLPKFSYLTQEIYVYGLLDNQGSWHDILTCKWVEGETLSKIIEWAVNANNKEKIIKLTQQFDSLALYLLTEPWAHGDIKPDNIIITPSGQMVLIDFDAMYYPGCPSQSNQLLGTTTFQHPLRDENFFNPHLDDYSLLIISTSLHALCCDMELYKKYHHDDNIILTSEEIFNNNSLSYNILYELWHKNTTFTLMLDMLKSKTPEIDNLEQLFIKLCNNNV